MMSLQIYHDDEHDDDDDDEHDDDDDDEHDDDDDDDDDDEKSLFVSVFQKKLASDIICYSCDVIFNPHSKPMLNKQ